MGSIFDELRHEITTTRRNSIVPRSQPCRSRAALIDAGGLTRGALHALPGARPGKRDEVAFPEPMMPPALDDFEEHISTIAFDERLQEQLRRAVWSRSAVDQDTSGTQCIQIQSMPRQTCINLIVVTLGRLHEADAALAQGINRPDDVLRGERDVLHGFSAVIG